MLIDTNWIIGLHIPASIVPVSYLWTTNILLLLVLVISAKQLSLNDLLQNRPNQHVYFGAMVVLLLMWGFKAGITPGLGFHHLGATIFTLMFGWPLAIVGLTVIMLLSILLPSLLAIDPVQSSELLSIGINGCLSIVIPVFLSYLILKFSQRFLPDNFFIYIFVVAFFGAGLAVAVSRLSVTAVMLMSETYPMETLIEESLQYLPLFMFPEMFVTGMLISIFVVYRPDWVLTFDDNRYLIGK